MATANPLGELISVDSVAKGRRGATATYDDNLLELLSQLDANSACLIGGFKVSRSDYQAKDDFANERQRIGAVIRKHIDHLSETGRLEAGTKVSINWHPELDVPQVSIKG